MNLREIQLDAAQALRQSQRSPLHDTLILFAMSNLTALVISLLYYALDRAVAGVGGGIDAAGARTAYSMANAALYILSIAANLAAAVLSFGYWGVMLRRVRREPVSGRDLWRGFRMVLRVIALSLLTTIQIALWSMLLVIPGLVAFYRYRFAVLILYDHPQMTALQALRESIRRTRGRKLTLLRMDLRFWYYYIPLFAAALLMNIDTIALLFDFWGIPSFLVLSYAQTLAIYAAGIVLTGIVTCWKQAHATASIAALYAHWAAQDEAEPMPV